MLVSDIDAARVQLLYRIPMTPMGERLLEVTVATESILREQNWGGVHVVADVSCSKLSASPADIGVKSAADPSSFRVVHRAGDFPFRKGSFDVVILHGTLDYLATQARDAGRSFMVDAFLAQVAGLLADGGQVMGCVENRYGLNRLLRGVGRRSGRGNGAVGARPVPSLSVTGCRGALVAAGFSDIRLFSVFPGVNSPRRLLSIEEGWSRRVCKRHSEALRPLVGPTGYLAWRILAELGISQYLGEAIFFWGRKTC